MAQSCSCNDFNRAALLRRGVAMAGKGLPRIEPGMPLPAGTGMDRRTFLLARPARRCRCTAPRCSARATSKRASPRPWQPRGPTSRCSSRSSWKAAGTHCRCWRPSGPSERRRSVQRLRPKLSREAKEALEKGSGKLFTEDPTLMWHPSATGLAELHEEGKVTAFPAIGYEPQDDSHFTSRHYWEVGQLDTNTRTGWMGRYLDLPASANRTTRSRASRSTIRWRRRWPRRRCPSRRSPRPPTTRCGPKGWANP